MRGEVRRGVGEGEGEGERGKERFEVEREYVL